MLCGFFVFEAAAPDFGNFETTGERRIYLMAAQPNRDSTLIWRKSSASGESGGCVEVAKSESSVLVRDSRDRPGGVLVLSCAQWDQLLRRIKGAKAKAQPADESPGQD
jgi:hypothetical protein